jgi:hypothetical protein
MEELLDITLEFSEQYYERPAAVDQFYRAVELVSGAKIYLPETEAEEKPFIIGYRIGLKTDGYLRRWGTIRFDENLPAAEVRANFVYWRSENPDVRLFPLDRY